MSSRQPVHPHFPSRRRFLELTGAGAAGSLAAFAGLPAFTAAAAEPHRPATDPRVDDSTAVRLWYTAPAAADNMIQQGLPIGNGRLGALVGGDPADEALFVTDATMWTGGRNDVLSSDGQFPYDRTAFGTLTQLAHLTVEIPGHTLDSVTGYRRTLDLSNGLVTASYTQDGVTLPARGVRQPPRRRRGRALLAERRRHLHRPRSPWPAPTARTPSPTPPTPPPPSPPPSTTACATAPPSRRSAAPGRSKSRTPAWTSPTAPT